MNVSYDLYNRTEPTELYIAKPGKRIIGKILGVQEDTAHVDVNFNNANTLEFSMSRNLNGKVNPIYDFVEFHYEIYAKDIGWFKIKEVPQIESNGENEVKSVTAEALETELQQYDLVGFEINTAQPSSREYLATDNTYINDEDYEMFHDRVLFYRDTTSLTEVIDLMNRNGDTSVNMLKSLVPSHPQLVRAWRVDINNYNSVKRVIQDMIDSKSVDFDANPSNPLILYRNDIPVEELEDLLDHFDNLEKIEKKDFVDLIDTYPEVLSHLSYSIDSSYEDDTGHAQNYNGKEIVELEIKREKDLSLLDLVLSDHGWTVGFVDDYVNTDANADEEEKIPLKNLVGTFQVDSMDIYSFLTQDVQQFFNCIFQFDCDNYKVNALRLSHVGNDTSIALNFHNLQTQIQRNSERPLYTVYHLQGADGIDPTQANYGLDYIEDISYFLNTDHFPQSFIDKYNNWKAYYDNHIAEYIQKSIDYKNQLDIVTEIDKRVPNDGLNTGQYKSFSVSQLTEEKALYQAQLRGYEALYVDENNEFDESIMQLPEHKVDYADYQIIKKQIIPNIERELANREVASVQDELKYLDNYAFDFVTYGDAYGLEELKTRQLELKNNVDTYIKRKYNLTPNSQDPMAVTRYEEYQRYQQALNEINAEIVERQAEYDAAKAILDEINDERLQMKAAVTKTPPNFGFTSEELALLEKYYIHTDYVNENITITDIDTNAEVVQKEFELIQSAEEELYADSHPQWSWSTTLDNLLLIPEFKPWYGQLDVGNYVRVTLREDDIQPMFNSGTGINPLSSIQEKLRVIRIGFNPFLLEDTIDIEFSTMVRYKSKRNDFAAIMDMANASTKNKITSTMATYNRGNTINVDPEFLMKILKDSKFNSYLNNAMGNFAASGGIFDSIITNTLKADTADISKAIITDLWASAGFIERVTADNMSVTSYLKAIEVDANRITAGTLIADRILLRGRLEDGSYTDGVLFHLNTMGREMSEDRDIMPDPQVVSETVSYNSLEGYLLEPNTVNADRIVANSITAHEITTANIYGSKGWINLAQGTFEYGGTAVTETDEYGNEIITGFTPDANNHIEWNGQTLSIKGNVTATTGNIGGWTINANYLGKGNIGQSGSAFLWPAGTTATICGAPRSNLVFTAGANFGVASDGTLYATGAVISGTLTAGANSVIGPWTVGTTYIRNGNITSATNTTVKGVYLGSDGLNISNGTAATTSYITKTGVNIGNKLIWNGTTLSISGTITANNGYIGDWVIENNGLWHNTYNTYILASNLQYSTLPKTLTGSGNFIMTNLRQGEIFSGSGTYSGSNITNTNYVNIVGMNGYLQCYIKTSGGTEHITTVEGTGITTPSLQALAILEGGTALGNKYAPISHSHPYLSTSGGTLSGGLTISSGNLTLSSGALNGYVTNNSGSTGYPVRSSTDADKWCNTIQCKNSSGDMVVYGSWGTNNGNTTKTFSVGGSDRRLKSGISDTNVKAIDIINRIRHRQFTWTKENKYVDIGYIAQELEEINPNLVFPPTNSESYYTVNTFYLEGLATKAIQELAAENEELRRRIDRLEDLYLKKLLQERQ